MLLPECRPMTIIWDSHSCPYQGLWEIGTPRKFSSSKIFCFVSMKPLVLSASWRCFRPLFHSQAHFSPSFSFCEVFWVKVSQTFLRKLTTKRFLRRFLPRHTWQNQSPQNTRVACQIRSVFLWNISRINAANLVHSNLLRVNWLKKIALHKL